MKESSLEPLSCTVLQHNKTQRWQFAVLLQVSVVALPLPGTEAASQQPPPKELQYNGWLTPDKKQVLSTSSGVIGQTCLLVTVHPLGATQLH
jgi:hypothetical protein